MPQQMPTLEHETRLWNAGYRCIAGVDEVGRGALAGPVVAAAVALPIHAAQDGVWAEVRDSKLLAAAQRERLAEQIKQEAQAWGVGACAAEEIDQFGIAAATRLAMARALACLAPAADYLLIDWVRLDAINIPQESMIKADAHIVSVAAASILAKVWRDRWMSDHAEAFPDFGFAANNGYGTGDHLAAITRCGPCAIHRHSFAPMRLGLFES